MTSGHPRLRTAGAVAVATLAVLLAGCAPTPAPDEWTLEPLSFETTLRDHAGASASQGSGGERTDLAFGFHSLAADGSGGFWAVSGGSWLHLGADGETLARFNADDQRLGRVTAITALSPTELLVVRDDGAPVLAVLDIATMRMRDLPGEAPSGSGRSADFGDFAFGDVARTPTGDAIVVRYQPRPPGYLDYEVLRVDLDDGTRTVLFSESLSLKDAPAAAPGLPPVDIDVDPTGAIHLATPTARIVLEPDGSERSRIPQATSRPRVAVGPGDEALWWGASADAADAQRGVIVGGSSAARDAVHQRETCDAEGDGLILSDVDGEHPLSFLCGANAAVWTGSSWVVATGGEGDGVLVRLTPPSARR